jgi:hypothetical protein
MSKRPIKIIKRESGEIVPSPPTDREILMQQQKNEVEDERDMKKAVKNWISERRENSKAEEVYSNRQLFDWDSEESPTTVD